MSLGRPAGSQKVTVCKFVSNLRPLARQTAKPDHLPTGRDGPKLTLLTSLRLQTSMTVASVEFTSQVSATAASPTSSRLALAQKRIALSEHVPALSMGQSFPVSVHSLVFLWRWAIKLLSLMDLIRILAGAVLIG